MNAIFRTEAGKRLQAIDQSREMDVYQNSQALLSSFQVFEGNFGELIALLKPLEDPMEVLHKYAAPEKREDLDSLLKETKRLIHNFLSSAKSLVDHTRVIVDRLYPEGHEFRTEYQSRINQKLADNTLQKFIQRFRNYTQHYALPILGLQIQFQSEPESASSTLKVDVEMLKKWNGWGSSKAYLESFDEGLPLIALASSYYLLIQDFYAWLSGRQEELHKDDFDRLDKMQREVSL